MLKIMSDLTKLERIDFTASAGFVTSGYQGQWIQPGSSTVAYPTSGVAGGAFQIWTEGNRDGTAGFTPDATNNGKVTVIYGKYRARTDRFNGALSAYDVGTPLTVDADGDLVPARYVNVSGVAGVGAAVTADKVVAYCVGEGSMTYFTHNGGSAFDYIEYVTV